MKISKELGRLALNYVGRYNKHSSYNIYLQVRTMGGRGSITFTHNHFDTLMCLIASIAGVKHD